MTGTIRTRKRGLPLEILFIETATVESVQAVIRAVTYGKAAESPHAELKAFHFFLTDGDGGASELLTTTVEVLPRALFFSQNFSAAPLKRLAGLFASETLFNSDDELQTLDDVLADIDDGLLLTT